MKKFSLSIKKISAIVLLLIGLLAIQPVLAKSLNTSGAVHYWSITAADAPQSATAFSLKLDSSGTPHMALGGDHLYYATRSSGNWDLQVVDNTPGVGGILSMVLDSNGYPHIAYRQIGEVDSVHFFYLKYAYWNGSIWTIKTVTNNATNMSAVAIVLDSSNTPWIVYSGNELTSARWNGSSWTFNSVTEECSPPTSMTMDSSGTPYVSFNCKGLKYAKWNGSSWDKYTIDSFNNEPVTGRPTSIAVDSTGNPHIAYVSQDSKLKYISWNGSVWGTSETIVASGLGSWEGIDLKIDGSDHPRVGYTLDNSAKIISFDGNIWSTQTVATHPYLFDINIGIDSHGLSQSVYSSYRPYGIFYNYENTTIGNWAVEEIIAKSSEVGRHASITVDKSNRPHIAYLDFDQYKLRYSTWDGTQWNNQVIDDSNDWHLYSSIKTDSLNYPHIAYTGTTGLKYAYWDGYTWQIQTVAAGGNYASLDLDSTDTPHIAYCSSGLKYASWNGSSWDIQSVDSVCGGGDFGGDNSMALDNNDIPHIVYSDNINNEMKYATWNTNTSTWNIQVVATHSAGRSLALDNQGMPHIAYCGIDPLYAWWVIRYVSWDGSSWVPQTVDPAYYCQIVSLAIDSNNTPHISYPNVSINSIKYSTWNGASWSVETVRPNTEWTGINFLPIAVGPGNDPWIAFEEDYSRDLYVAHSQAVVTSITRADPNPTSAASVNFTVTFSESVTGVDSSDFALTTDVICASVAGVSGGDDSYMVTVNTGSCNGKIRLDVPVTATITDLAGNLLANLPFITGEAYNIELIKNGGFNIYPAGKKIPTNWKAVNFSTTDGKNTTVKQEGTASVRIGGTGVSKTLSQTLMLNGLKDDAFTFSFWVKGSAIPTAGICRAQILFYNGATLNPIRKTVNCGNGTYAFKQKPLSFFAPGDYTKIVIRFTYSKASGRVWFDAVILVR